MALAHLAGRPLTWIQPHAFTPAHELRDGDRVLGTLEFRSSLGTLATARFDDGCWTMKRMGFLHTRVEIRRCGEEAALALFHNNTWSGGGTLVLANKREFRANTNFWHSRYEFVDDGDRAIVRYTSGGWMKTSGEMVVTEAGAGLPELPWVAMLGWYLVVMMRNDSAAAAAVVAAG
jgi:hypothetical protein